MHIIKYSIFPGVSDSSQILRRVQERSETERNPWSVFKVC